MRAAGEENEMRGALRSILRDRTTIDRAEIVYSARDPYLSLAYELTSEYEIPATFAEGIAATFTRPGQAAIGFLEWIADDFATDPPATHRPRRCDPDRRSHRAVAVRARAARGAHRLGTRSLHVAARGVHRRGRTQACEDGFGNARGEHASRGREKDRGVEDCAGADRDRGWRWAGVVDVEVHRAIRRGQERDRRDGAGGVAHAAAGTGDARERQTAALENRDRPADRRDRRRSRRRQQSAARISARRADPRRRLERTRSVVRRRSSTTRSIRARDCRTRSSSTPSVSRSTRRSNRDISTSSAKCRRGIRRGCVASSRARRKRDGR